MTFSILQNDFLKYISRCLRQISDRICKSLLPVAATVKGDRHVIEQAYLSNSQFSVLTLRFHALLAIVVANGL